MDQLIEQAEDLGIPIPRDDERYWEQRKYAPHQHLSEAGQEFLRLKVREEHKTRREIISFWFNIVTVILSLLVAILALTK